MADERRPELGTVTVGQTVIVSPSDPRQKDVRATVAKVGRVWIELKPEDGFFLAYYERRFRLSDQRTESRTGTGTYFYTEDQYAWDRRKIEARKFLRDAGIAVDDSYATKSRWKGREVELANLLRAHEGLEPL